jgi:antitoxin (DNA-binding transcriptional repressor) of toxin-antitoxin stability system
MLRQQLHDNAAISTQVSQMLVQVSAGEVTPVTAANRIIAQLRRS